MEIIEQKKVTIITGFLGAGKTTFLNHLINSNADTRYAIIENEFGKQGVDAELVVKPDETIVELNNGCLCCSLNDNLYDILNELHTRRDSFDEVIIEATGIADPTGLAQPFIAHPLIKKHFPLASIICLVDAELVEDQIKETEEAKNQIGYSDVIIINKTDLVSPKYVNELQERLAIMNPLATILRGYKDDYSEIDFKEDNQNLEEIYKDTFKAVGEDEIDFPVDKPHYHTHQHTKDINSIVITLDKPFDAQKLKMQLTMYLLLQSKDLYRMKGFVWINDDDNQYLLQSVGKRFDFSVKRKWKEDESKQTLLVFIGKNLKREGLERMLNTCLV